MKHYIVLGVTGGIAAYKALDLVSGLKKRGVDMNVILTQNACQIVTPLSFQTLSHNYVITDTFQEPKQWEVEHVELAKKAELMVIAPATANIIGKVANGIADDMLSTTIMASRCPVLFVPAMNTRMYENPIVQANITRLKALGYHFIEPDTGYLACGDIGKGKFPPVEKILNEVMRYLEGPKDLEGKHFLITAGPTIEAIDPMRYLTNHSSGKMGYALAQCAARRGAVVKLISGPTHLETPYGVERIDIQSARDMYEEVHQHFEWADVVIKAAAVADYRPLEISLQKIKKKDGELTLQLTRNPDILKSLGERKQNKILVGFAAETQNIEDYAKEKLVAKNLDFIVANDISKKDSGFGGEENQAFILARNGDITYYEKMSKVLLADHILDHIQKACH